MSLSPSRKSSSMFSICVPAFRRWELHQAVKVWGGRTEGGREGECGCWSSPAKGPGRSPDSASTRSPWGQALGPTSIYAGADLHSDPGRLTGGN